MIKKALLLLSFSCVLTVPVQAQTTLKQQDVIQAIIKSFPLLQNARMEVKRARFNLVNKQGIFDLTLNSKLESEPFGNYPGINFDTKFKQLTNLWGTQLFGGYRISQGNFPVYEGKKETNEGGEFLLGLETPLLRDGLIDKKRAGVAIADIKLNIANWKLKKSQLKYLKKGLKTYWKWRSQGQIYLSRQRLLNKIKRRNLWLKEGIQLGQYAEIEFLDNQKAYFNRQQELLESALEFEKLSNLLTLYIGESRKIESRKALDLIPDFNGNMTRIRLPEPVKDFQVAHNMRPELQILLLEQEQAKVKLKLSDNQIFPLLDFQLYLSQDVGTKDPKKQRPEMNANLLFQMPLQNRKARGQQGDIQGQIAVVVQKTNFNKHQIQTEVLNSRVQLNNFWKRLQISQQDFKLATQLVKLEQDSFKLGKSSLFKVNQREQKNIDSEVKLIKNKMAYLQAISEYHLTLGLIP